MVTVGVTRAMLAAFRASEHLRGSDGKFISVGGSINVKDRNGKVRRAKVTALTPSGPTVTYADNGRSATIPSQLAVTRISAAPSPLAHIPTGNRVNGVSGRNVGQDTFAERASSKAIPGTSWENQQKINDAETKFGAGSVQHDAAIGQFGGKGGTPGEAPKPPPPPPAAAAPAAPRRRRAPAAAPGGTPASPATRPPRAAPATPPPAVARAKGKWAKLAQNLLLPPGTVPKSWRTASGWITLTHPESDMPVTAAMLAAAFSPEAVTAGLFDSWRHPRDSRGRFIEIGSDVDVNRGDGDVQRGTVTGLNRDGVEVTFHGGGVSVVQTKNIEVAPQARGRVDVRATTPRHGMGDVPMDEGTVADLRAPSRGFPNIPSTGSVHTVQNPDGTVSWTPERQALHDQIISEALQGKTPVDNPMYNIMGGGPASGKSTMVNSGFVPELQDPNSVMVNADEMKLKLPEWTTLGPSAASATHEESSYLAKRLQAAAFENRFHTTLDGTGDGSMSGLQKKIDAAKASGYAVNGFYVTIPTAEAVKRSDKRAIHSGRHVPASVISSTHIEVSKIFPEKYSSFDQVALFDNTNGLEPVMSFKGGVLDVQNPTLWTSFKAKGSESVMEDHPAPTMDTAPTG